MLDLVHAPAHLMLAYSAYALGTASPGPSNLAIMATAMHAGRKPALVFALGVASGSVFWGLLAACGLSALLATYSKALIALKVLGGLYLLWLAAKSARAALSRAVDPAAARASMMDVSTRTYLKGAAMHVTNPKAIFVWVSIVALALPAGAGTGDALLVVAGCAVIGLAVFCAYALAFSQAPARRIYLGARRWFEGTFSLFYGYAGIRMLASRT